MMLGVAGDIPRREGSGKRECGWSEGETSPSLIFEKNIYINFGLYSQILSKLNILCFLLH